VIFTIAGRELRSLFLSPLAWAILAVTLFILAYLFLTQIETYLTLQPRLAAIEGAPGVADIVVAPLFADAAVVLLLITPLITMRALSEERRNRTISLLFSAPVSMTEIVMGKYLGILSFFLILLGLLALMPQTGGGHAGTNAGGSRVLCHRPVHVIIDRTTNRGCRGHLWTAVAALDCGLGR